MLCRGGCICSPRSQSITKQEWENVLKLDLINMTLTYLSLYFWFCVLQVILMVGLPGSGKTQWALKYAKENPEKRYNVLGAETVLNQMRVSCCWGYLSDTVFALHIPRDSYNLSLMES